MGKLRRVISLSMLWVLLVPATAHASLFSRIGQNRNSAGYRVAGYGTSASNWVVDQPVLDPDGGMLINSIYCTAGLYEDTRIEVGWHKRIGLEDDAQAFAVHIYQGQPWTYEETALGRLTDNATNYFSLVHVPGTYTYKAYINSVHVHTFPNWLGVNSSYSVIGSERMRYGDRNEASFGQLKYRPTDTSWDYWSRVMEHMSGNPDPHYFFYGDSTNKKAWVY